MFENPLRPRLQSGATTYGLWVTLESPTVTELAALLGLDWVCIDMEHGHLDFAAVQAHIRTLRGSSTAALVRVPEIQHWLIKRVLDMGAHGLILPLVSSRADLDRAIGFGRYPPDGHRSIGGERAVQWGLDMTDYVARANREIMLIPLIETRAAVENIDAILDAPGLEAIFFGPNDMSASYGYPGQWEGPGVAEHVLDVRRRAADRGIAAGILSRSTDNAKLRRDQGFNLIGLGADANLLIRAIRDALAVLKPPAG
jgi:2-keto-3-deoxy-L-rhamnonate aldolase RhmA